jgi:hypothetical protein
MAKIIENSGKSEKEAIIVAEAANHEDGMSAEYGYLAKKFGIRGKDWKVKSQALIFNPLDLLETKSPPVYDVMEIQLTDGRTEKLFFDIRSFFFLK